MGPKSQFQHPQVGKPCTFSIQNLLCASDEPCLQRCTVVHVA